MYSPFIVSSCDYKIYTYIYTVHVCSTGILSQNSFGRKPTDCSIVPVRPKKVYPRAGSLIGMFTGGNL